MVPVDENTLRKGICSHDLAKQASKVAKQLSAAETQILDFLKEDAARHPAKEQRYCIYDPEAVPFNSDTIFKYTRTWRAIARHDTAAFLVAAAYTTACALISLNLYYRGFVYVIFGGRRLRDQVRTQ